MILTLEELQSRAKRKALTAEELGYYLIFDSWQYDHGREATMSERLYEELSGSLSPSERALLDIYWSLYRAIDRTRLEAEILYLRARLWLQALYDAASQYQLWLSAIVGGSVDGSELGAYTARLLEHIRAGFVDTLERLAKESLAEESLAEDEPDIVNIRETIARLRDEARESVKRFLAARAVMADLARITGVTLTEDIDIWEETLREMAEGYAEHHPDDGSLFHKITDKDTRLPQLYYERLKPDRGFERYYEERFALSLGQAWRESILEAAHE